jgi:hypothetical protein
MPREPGVYDDGRAHDMPSVGGPRVPRARGRIRGGLCSFLRAGIRCTITLIPLLITAAIWPRDAQSNPLGDLAHHGLRHFVRSLHGD